MHRPVSFAQDPAARTGVTRRRTLGGLAAGTLATASIVGAPLNAVGQTTKRLHFLVPAGVGGGWDQTARAVAEAVTKAGLVESATLEHVSGDGGARAISYLVATGQTQPQTLMVSSTPIVLRAVRGAQPSYRDLEPIAALIGDHAVIAVRADGPYRDFAALAAAVRRAPNEVRIAGGSVRGGMDHVLAARMFSKASGVDPRQVVYYPYDAGGGALDALMTRQVHAISTGLGEVLDTPHAADIHILAVTSTERVPEAAKLPTLRELGHDVTFTNWRGFFGAPQLPVAAADAHAALLGRVIQTPEWEAIRARHGWQTLYRPRAEFAAMLAGEEEIARQTLSALGII